MPRFEPFAGLRYAPGTDVDAVTAPPYDVIDAEERARLAARSDSNAVLFDLPDEADGPGRYDAADALLRDLQDRGVLVTDDAPSFYVYRMVYDDEQGRERRTTGILGALQLSRPGEGGILPHEHTTPKAKSDRLDLLRSTRHNLSPIWGLSLAAGLTDLCRTDGPPDMEATDEDGVRHQLWRVTDPARLSAISDVVNGEPVVIADGHHRYETSLAYRDERRAVDGEGGDYDATLAYVVELTEDELAVRPIHRLLHGQPRGEELVAALTAELFDGVRADADLDLPGRMAEAGGLGLVLPGGDAYVLVPRAGAFPDDMQDLDSSRLAVALETMPALEVEYQHGTDTILRRVSAGEATAGVLLRPAGVPQIAATAHTGTRMPPKTTFFWPKPRTGFVFRNLG
ncbi:MAG: hypothetical protein JWN67_3204 [Actinomycetia bacterium]|nr:hypothetical protein [Actinomycetes bacterium]